MKNWILWILLLFLEVSTAIAKNAYAPIVSTKNGKVRGTRILYKGSYCIDVYYGIPFAKPPVGDLRFKRTVPVEGWDDVLDARVKPPACPQVPFDVESLDKESEQKEDCLYLNIWAPCSKKKKAVMVWIYGGSFRQGSGSMSIYDGSVLASRDVIVVTVNYRVGILGFAFSNTTDAPGNAGMFDQAEALTWVQKNIEEFGGNASSITLFGQSAGSISISLLAVSPLTWKLFHRAIMESGSAVLLISGITPVVNRNTTDAIAKAVNCSSLESNIQTQPEAVMNCMRGKDMETLIKYSSSYPYTPQYGDPFMPKDPRLEIISGKSKNCDRLIGVTKDEGALFWARTFVDIYGRYGEKVQHPILDKTQARSMMKQILLRFGIPPSVSEPMIEYYLSKVQGDNNEEVLRQAVTAVGDNAILCPCVYEAEQIARQGNKVYFYKYSHRPTCTKTRNWTGVPHFSEVPFVFGRPLQQNKSECEMQYTRAEMELSREMILMWTNFAKTGSPTCHNISWPLYSQERPSYLVLNTTKRFKIGQGPHRENCNFLRKFYGT